MKDGSNPWWAAYQVTNAKNPINGMSLSVDGGTTWLEMVGPEEPAPSGFWFMKPSNLILNNEMENYKIRVESDTGDIVVNMVGVVASSETDSGTNNGGGVDCGGQGGSGSEGPEISTPSTTQESAGTPEGTSGVTPEGTLGVTEGPVGSCEELIVDKNGWTGNWQGKLKFLLSSDVSDYTITFTTDVPVTSLNFWEGQLTGSATSFTLQSPSYFAGKKEGEYLEHGFQLSYSGNTEPKFTSITFNGVDLCSGGSPGGATEVTQNPTGGATNPGTSGSGFATEGPSGGCLKDKIYYDHGEVTAYGNNPTGGHCGFTELPSAEARKHFVAISSQDAEGWRDGLYCGSCVRLRYTDGHVSQIIFTFSYFILQELIGYIHDSCPSCPKYHWDLSDYMYLNLTNEQSVGKVYHDNN